MKGHTYRDLALRYEVEVCFDGCFRRDHGRGAVDSQGTIHWRDKLMTRSGLRRFLMLVGEVEIHTAVGTMWARHPSRELRARRIYVAHSFAYQTALHDLGIRLPASLAAADKARVRSLLAAAPFELRNSKVGRWAGLR